MMVKQADIIVLIEALFSFLWRGWIWLFFMHWNRIVFGIGQVRLTQRWPWLSRTCCRQLLVIRCKSPRRRSSMPTSGADPRGHHGTGARSLVSLRISAWSSASVQLHHDVINLIWMNLIRITYLSSFCSKISYLVDTRFYHPIVQPYTHYRVPCTRNTGWLELKWQQMCEIIKWLEIYIDITVSYLQPQKY